MSDKEYIFFPDTTQTNHVDTRILFLDTETTGTELSQGHRIIEIACIEMIGREITGDNFHTYLNPDRHIEQGATRIHGIDNSMVDEQPRFAEVVDKLLEYVRDAEIIAHNAQFDIDFLNREIDIANEHKDSHYPHFDHVCAQVTDNLALARKRFPGMRNSLDALCNRLNIDNSERSLHSAMLDASLLAKVWLKLTAGQKALRLDVNTDDITRKQAVRNSDKSLRIIRASDDELARHHAFMKKLQTHAS